MKIDLALASVTHIVSPRPFAMWFQLVDNLVRFVVLSFAVGCVARTVCNEDLFKEARKYCAAKSEACDRWIAKKFFYVWTCEYCFSHWVTLIALLIFQFRLLWDDWRGFLLAFYAMPFLANWFLKKYAGMSVEVTFTKADTELKKAAANGLSPEPRQADSGSDSPRA